MTLEPVVGEEPTHVRVPGKEHPIEIVSLALEPVGAGKNADDRGDRRRLVDLGLHPHAQVLLGREEMIDDVEAPLAARPVHRGDVDDAPELAALVVTQETDDFGDVAGERVDGQLAIRNPIADDRARESAGDDLAEFVEPVVHCAKPISVRWYQCGGSSSAAATRRRAALRPSADNRARRYRPARCDRSHAQPNRNSGSNRRRWRTSPWK